MSSNPSLALLAPLFTSQLDGLAVVLKDAAARIETIKAAAAQATERERARTEQPVERSSERESEPKDDPNRIVTLAEAAHLSSLSVDTLRRKHRDKFVQLSERRLGMRRRDALNLSG
jgi:hypothetical protein